MIARITLTGGVTEFAIDRAGGQMSSQPMAIAAGSDGNIWFTDFGNRSIGRITPQGAVTQFPLPPPASRPEAIAAGSDGNVWFTESSGRIGWITTSGNIGERTEITLVQHQISPGRIAWGSDGQVWFIAGFGDKIGRLSVHVSAANVHSTLFTITDGDISEPAGARQFVGALTSFQNFDPSAQSQTTCTRLSAVLSQ